ncbi:MAG: hypothetical protein MR762_04450, partial [Clostridiales bacterium]|nr:hypothetical protein [Clostridiales bacterium]
MRSATFPRGGRFLPKLPPGGKLAGKLEDIEHSFFYFLVRCDLVKIVNGVEYVITSAYGSGNTREGRTG